MRSMAPLAVLALPLVMFIVLASPALAGDAASVSSLQDPEEIPVAFAGSDETIYSGDTVAFNGSASTDDVGIVSYTWTFRYGDLNRTFANESFEFRFTETGTYNVTLNVTDADGHWDTDVVTIIVLPQPVDYIATYWILIPIIGGILAVIIFLRMAMQGKIRFISEPRREKIRLEVIRQLKIGVALLSNIRGLLGVVILVFFMILAAAGPEIAPYTVDLSKEEGKFLKNAPPGVYAIDAPSYVVPLKIAFPLVFCLAAAAVMLLMSRRHPFLDRYWIDARGLGASAIISGVLLALALAHATSVMEIESSEWLVAASVIGPAVAVASFAWHRRTRYLRETIALVLPLFVPIVVVAPIFLTENADALLLGMGFSEMAGGMLLIGTCLLLRSANLRFVRLNPELIGTEEGKRLARAGRIATIFALVVGFAVIFAGLMSILELHWTEHWMGTDLFGFDIFSKLLFGARTSIIVGLVSALIASVVGAGVGLYSGYAGGWKDEVVMRANDVVLSIPWLVLMIIIAGLLQEINLTGIILIIGLTGWSPTARLVRSQVLSLKERQYVERARAIGASDMSIIRRHILPNAFPLVFANTILIVAISILSESALSFLGLRPQGTVTWGTMLSYAAGVDTFRIGLYWWLMAPGLCIVIVVLGFTLVGYALDDILNPRLRKR